MQETVSAPETGSWAQLLGSPEGKSGAGLWGTQLWAMLYISDFTPGAARLCKTCSTRSLFSLRWSNRKTVTAQQ